MAKFYFTFGSEGHPFVGGWAEVHADNEDLAREAFRLIHPNRDGCLCCCDVYPEAEFERTKMYAAGNMGHRCREIITLTRELVEEVAHD